MTHAPIVFLDVDGPMVPGRSRMLLGNSFMKFGWTFDPVAVSMLNFLYWALPDLKIVVASHRLGDIRMKSPFEEFPNVHTKSFWGFLLEENGIAIPLHHDWHTPRKEPRAKYLEIDEWLLNHRETNRFVVLDDDLNNGDAVSRDMRKKFHLVGEDYNNGLSWRDFELMCFHLGLSNAKDKYKEWSLTAA